MNENLLNTFIVKAQVKRYLSEGMSFKDILIKLEWIHLIKINQKQLKEYIELNNLDVV